MQNRDVLGSWVNAHPRETMKLAWLGSWLVWQAPAMGFGLLCYWLFRPYEKDRFLFFLMAIGVVTLPCIALQLYWCGSLSVYAHYGWGLNKQILFSYLHSVFTQPTYMMMVMGFNYTFGLAPVVAAGLCGIDLLPVNLHQKTLAALQQGKQLGHREEKSEKVIQAALANLPAQHPAGTVLGVSVWNADPVILPDQAVNQVVLVLGTTGCGKTVTLRRFYTRAIHQRYPLIIIDGKPSDKNVAWVKGLADQQETPFYGFNCGECHHYDSLAQGGQTELKDKIICLKDQWENDYYRSIAEDYLQVTIEVLLKAGQSFDLADIVTCLSFDELVVRVRKVNDRVLMERVKSLQQYDSKDITGLQAHLNLILHSELGDYLKQGNATFNLTQVVDENAVVYFALPALRFPSFSKLLGKLVVNDIKSVIDRHQGEKRLFTIFDEFSVFAGEQVLNLVNMGRDKGVHAIFGTQGLADLEKVGSVFKDQILNCANTLICHRLNDQNSTESVANWIGTKEAFTVTAQLNVAQSEGGLGSVRVNKEFLVHPDEIKQNLKTGEAHFVSKVGEFRRDKVRVKC